MSSSSRIFQYGHGIFVSGSVARVHILEASFQAVCRHGVSVMCLYEALQTGDDLKIRYRKAVHIQTQ